MVRVKGSRKTPSNRIARQSGRQSRNESTIARPLVSPTGPGGSFLSNESTPNLILEAAKRLFAAKGFDGTSVKELSEAAGTNICLISYHFGGKEGLYRTCLQQFGDSTGNSVEQILRTPKTAAEFE